MTKFELIEEIRSLNSTASVDFLSQFDEYELQEYIDHLRQVDKDQLTASTTASIPFN